MYKTDTRKFFQWCGQAVLSLYVSISFFSCCYADENSDVISSYGYVVGQNYTLDLIQKKFPNLKGYALFCQNDFLNSPLGSGWSGIDKKLQKSSNYKNFKSKLINGVKNEIGKQFDSGSITQEFARLFCDEVLERSKGTVPERVLVTLLKHNEDYLQAPAKEILDGWRSEYNTNGHPKAGPVDISISFPKTWKIKKGNRPHILSNWSRNYENFLAGANIQVTAAPQLAAFPDHEVYSYLRSDNSFTDWVPEGGRLISGEHYTIENIPFVCVTFDNELTRLDFSIVMRSTIFLSYYNGHIFQVNFNISSKDNELDKIQKRIFPLYKSIMNTLVINDKYNN